MANLVLKAKEIRRGTLTCIGALGVGHIGGALSIADLLAVLYFKHMNIDSKNPKMEGRDRLVVSKGHAGPAVYAALALKGYFKKADGFAVMLVNSHNPFDASVTANVRLEAAASKMRDRKSVV